MLSIPTAIRYRRGSISSRRSCCVPWQRHCNGEATSALDGRRGHCLSREQKMDLLHAIFRPPPPNSFGDRLTGGGSRIRTFRSSRDQCLSELVEPCEETTWRARTKFLRGGTKGSNPSPSASSAEAS